jgi:hypothetical protein
LWHFFNDFFLEIKKPQGSIAPAETDPRSAILFYHLPLFEGLFGALLLPRCPTPVLQSFPLPYELNTSGAPLLTVVT